MKQDSAASAISNIISQKRLRIAEKPVEFSDPDNLILKEIREGNYGSFGTLVRRYEDFVYTLISGLVRSPESAKDVTQEVFLRAYRSIRRFEQRSSFKTWLYRIAYNTAMAHLEREKKFAEREENAVIDTVDATYKRYDARITLEKIIAKLKPEYRAVITLHYYEDLKYEEIAETLDCPVGTVKIRLYRAKYELKQLWSKYAIQL